MKASEKGYQAGELETGHQQIEQGILQVIEKYLAENGTEVNLAIQVRCTEIEANHAHWIEDEQSRFHLRFTALMLASYQILQNLLPKEEVLPLLRQAFIEPMQQTVQAAARASLDQVADPFAEMTHISKEQETTYYGQTFAFERVQDDQYAYLLNVNRCFYHSFFIANGIPELMPLICDWDTETWAAAIDPNSHGFRFERPTTMGYGGNKCRFWFIRQSPDKLPVSS